jgi:hypothetical protein
MGQRTLAQDQLPQRGDKPAPDQDQDDPCQIVDLFSEVGHGLLSPQSPDEYGSHEENERSPCQSWAGFTIGTFGFEYPTGTGDDAADC